MEGQQQERFWKELVSQYPWVQNQGHVFRAILGERVATWDEFEKYCQRFEGMLPYWKVRESVERPKGVFVQPYRIKERIEREYPGMLVDLAVNSRVYRVPVYGVKAEDEGKVREVIAQLYGEKKVPQVIRLEGKIAGEPAKKQRLGIGLVSNAKR